jgi:hydroxylaminobenzene mutase
MPGPSRLGMLYETLKASESSEYQKSFAIMEALAPIMMLDPFISTVDQMSANTRYLTDQGHRLLEIGVLLLLFASFEGFGIPYVAVPAIGLAAHRLSALQSVLLLALGLTWPRLKLGAAASRTAFWLLIYSTVAILAAYVMAAFWGAGGSTLPLTAGTARGSTLQESLIRIVAYSSAPTGIASFGLVLFGLRVQSAASED